jgi:uncharacterized protein with HEPN domain
MSRDARLYLEDILFASQKVLRYTAGFSSEQFRQDDRTYDAVIRNLEIIGEAARNMPDDIRGRFPEVEWRSISAFRNLLAHEYFAIRDEIIWDIVQNKVPQLYESVQNILSKI